jgi:hypothetical protein
MMFAANAPVNPHHWVLCTNPTLTDEVTVSNSDGTTESMVIPPLNNSYPKFGVNWTPTVTPPVIPIISGETAEESEHTHSAGTLSTGTQTVTSTPNEVDVADDGSLTGDTGPGTAHKHGPGDPEDGGLVISDTGEPQHVEVVAYMRL